MRLASDFRVVWLSAEQDLPGSLNETFLGLITPFQDLECGLGTQTTAFPPGSAVYWPFDSQTAMLF